MKRKWILIVVLVLLLIIFVLQNKASVNIRLWFWEVDLPLSLLIFVCFAMGFIIGLFIDETRLHKKEKKKPIPPKPPSA